MSYFRSNIDDLEAYVPGFQPKGGGFIKLNTNENPYPPAPGVFQTLRDFDPERLRRYPDPVSSRLREKIADLYGFDPENVIVGNGSDELLAMALRCFAGAGDRVLYPRPSYSLYGVLSRIQGAEPVEMALEEDFGLSEEFIKAPARLKFIASPNSPTGTVYPERVIERLANETDGVIVVDEAYADFSDETALRLAGKLPNVMVLRTFSKSYSLAGLRVGYAFGALELIAGMMKVKDSYNMNTISALLAEAALDDQEYFQEKVGLIKAERGILREKLEELNFQVSPSGANFLFCR
ncbi:MAG TPA: histidinol-phosphate transaminase, partial [Proteobacteria bacterium]|nr:histidinol-phosphate transaminase [Pseudomonadota bacterium]